MPVAGNPWLMPGASYMLTLSAETPLSAGLEVLQSAGPLVETELTERFGSGYSTSGWQDEDHYQCRWWRNRNTASEPIAILHQYLLLDTLESTSDLPVIRVLVTGRVPRSQPQEVGTIVNTAALMGTIEVSGKYGLPLVREDEMQQIAARSLLITPSDLPDE
jgi:hypothetical protein